MFDEILHSSKSKKERAEKVEDPVGLQKYIAADGHSFPIFYNGSIVRIGSEKPVELDSSLLGYDGRIQLKTALDRKHISVVGA
jgi:hypothetical protein